MKPRPESQPPAKEATNAAPGSTKQKPIIEPPTQPFINLSGDGPVDPTKFQRFIVPMEFIQKANAVELPRLSPEDLADTGQQTPLIVPEEPPTASERTPQSATAPAATAGSTQDTVVLRNRRKSAPIPKELLDAPPTGKKRFWQAGLIIGLLGLLAFLIWFWTHSGESSDSYTESEPEASAAAPLPAVAAERAAPVAPASTAADTLAGADKTMVAPIDSASVVDIDSPEPADTARAAQRAKTADTKSARTAHPTPISSAKARVMSAAPNTKETPPAPSSVPSAAPIIGKMPWRDPD